MVVKSGISILFFMFLSLMVTVSAWAVPSFARQTKEACSYCHSSWPLLNSYGKEFKANGFKGLPDGLKISKDMLMPKNFPISARLNFRLADKRFSKLSTSGVQGPGDDQLKLRGLHEGEIMVAGKLDRAFYFLEFESEDEFGAPPSDEKPSGFGVQMSTGYGGYRFHPLATLEFGYMSPFVSDGNNTVFRDKPARYQWSASAKGFVPGISQSISLHGHFSYFSYILAYHGVDSSISAPNLEGKDPKDKSIRIAFEITGFSIGGFYSNGKRVYDSAQKSSRGSNDRWGVDLQYDGLPGLQINAIYGQKEVEEYKAVNGVFKDVTTTDNNLSIYAHYFPVDRFSIGVNFDTYTKNDRDDRTSSGAVFATCFIKENLKAQIGWEGTLSTPSGYKHDESRATFVIDLAL